MSEVRALRFSDVAWLLQKINEKLLLGNSGLLLQAEINEKNEVTSANIVTIQTALNNGFEPAKFVRNNEPNRTAP